MRYSHLHGGTQNIFLLIQKNLRHIFYCHNAAINLTLIITLSVAIIHNSIAEEDINDVSYISRNWILWWMGCKEHTIRQKDVKEWRKFFVRCRGDCKPYLLHSDCSFFAFSSTHHHALCTTMRYWFYIYLKHKMIIMELWMKIEKEMLLKWTWIDS